MSCDINEALAAAAGTAMYSGMPGYMCVTHGGGGSSTRVADEYPRLTTTCAEAVAAFQARDPCTFSPMLQTILAQRTVALNNSSGNTGVHGASVTDILAQMNATCPAAAYTSDEVNQLVMRGVRAGIFAKSPDMCVPNAPNTELIVCIIPLFGFKPQNHSLYYEMGNTPYYLYSLGILSTN